MPGDRTLVRLVKVRVLSCEHAGNRVPARWRRLFSGAQRALESHRGWDPGALVLAREFAADRKVPLLSCETTRLLADPNRSDGHRRLFSEWSRPLPPEEREAILDHAWRPHRAGVERAVRGHVARGRQVLHLSVHSFTPIFGGEVRKTDIGFLYDPSRTRERALVDRWIGVLGELRPDLRLRRNDPYRGTEDGLTRTLRESFPAALYLGIELEVSQRFPRRGGPAWRRLRADLVASLARTLSAAGGTPPSRAASRGRRGKRTR